MEFRRTGQHVTHVTSLALPHRHHQQNQASQRADQGVARVGDMHAQVGHQAVAHGLHLAGPGHEGRVETEEAGQHRQHDEVGDDLVGDAHRRRDGQLADHRDRHQHQRGKTDEGGDQGQRAGHQQAGEAARGGSKAVGAVDDLLGDVVHLLDAVGHADGEHQERHQHRQRVQPETQQRDGAELPHHRHQRAGQRQKGEHPRAGVPIHGAGSEQEGQRKELDDAGGAFRDVAHLLGEANDADVGVGIGKLVPHLGLQLLAEVEVIETLSGSRIGVGQFGHHHRPGTVVGHQAADEAADHRPFANARDVVGGQGLHRHVTADHVLGLHALLGDLHGAGVGRPQRRHRAPVHPGHEEQRLGDVVQLGEGLLVPDVALLRFHHHDDAVGAEEDVPVLVEGLDVFVVLRQLLVEAGRHPELRGEHPHQGGESQQHAQGQQPVPEEEALQADDQFLDHVGIPVCAGRPQAPGPAVRTSRRRWRPGSPGRASGCWRHRRKNSRTAGRLSSGPGSWQTRKR